MNMTVLQSGNQPNANRTVEAPKTEIPSHRVKKPTPVSVPKLQTIEDSRSPLSQASDERQQHSVIVEPDDPRVESWMRDYGRMDVRGIDTKHKGVKPKTKPKSRRLRGTPTSLHGIR